MKRLTVILALMMLQFFSATCYSQGAPASSRDAKFSTLTAADNQYARKLEDLDRSYLKKMKSLNAKYEEDRGKLQERQIKLLESGKSIAMSEDKLDAAITIRDRIAELKSATLAPPVDTDVQTVWKWDDRDWKFVFKGDGLWLEADKYKWTETDRSTECIFLKDKARKNIGMLYDNAFFYRNTAAKSWTMSRGSWLRDGDKRGANSSSNTSKKVSPVKSEPKGFIIPNGYWSKGYGHYGVAVYGNNARWIEVKSNTSTPIKLKWNAEKNEYSFHNGEQAIRGTPEGLVQVNYNKNETYPLRKMNIPTLKK